MTAIISRRAVLKHQNGHASANLIWGTPLHADLAARVPDGCHALRALGYFASPFPEGDGVAFSHPEYSPGSALIHVRAHFSWLDITDRQLPRHDLYGDEVVQCKALVPVERLHLTVSIDAKPYRFIPAIGQDESGIPHPWHDYLSGADADSIYSARETAKRSGQLGILRDDFLLTYPIVEISIDISYRELFAAEEYADGASPLLRRCSEYADRGVDLLRLEQCSYQQLERLPGIAGQLLDGFHAAYVVPSTGPFKPKLYCHLATAFQVSPNWLGLDVDREVNDSTITLAPIVHGPARDEMSQRVRGAIRAVGQAFYILTPEARFLSLVFALDGLCDPKKTWTGLAHHSYIAAVGSDGDSARFEKWLLIFDAAYANIRNPIVHCGRSFIELGADPAEVSDQMTFLIGSCVDAIVRHTINTLYDLHAHVLLTLNEPSFQVILKNFLDRENASRSADKQLKMPKW